MPPLIMQIFDNFLKSEEHEKLQSYMIAGPLPWILCKKAGDDDSMMNYQFIHPFFRQESQYHYDMTKSPHFDTITPILDNLNILALHRVKANLEPIKPERYYSDFHHDYRGSDGKPSKKMTTGIYYVNSNDGYTEFEDGKIVNSIANRLILFRSDRLHRGVSQLDSQVRCVINFNFFMGN